MDETVKPAKVKVPPEVFEGLCALRGNPDLDPEISLIPCLQYLSRYECYNVAERWIVDNFQAFWDGWEAGFLEDKLHEVKEAAPVA